MAASPTIAAMERRRLLALAAVMLFAGACAQIGSATGPSSRDRVVAAWHDAAQCMRDHGFPAPDPTVDDQGNATFPGDLPRTPDDVLTACQPYLDRIPDQPGDHGPSAATIHARRQFAACMRASGVPSWPDPDDQGRFPNTPALEAEGKSPALVAARQTCQHYLTKGGS